MFHDLYIYISIKWLVSILKMMCVCRIDDSCFRVKGELIEEATNRFFKVDDEFVLSDLKDMCRRFGL